VFLAAPAAGEQARQQRSAPPAYKVLRNHPTEYAGPGRELPDPGDDVDEVLIG
jgi:hypothetical protein